MRGYHGRILEGIWTPHKRARSVGITSRLRKFSITIKKNDGKLYNHNNYIPTLPRDLVVAQKNELATSKM